MACACVCACTCMNVTSTCCKCVVYCEEATQIPSRAATPCGRERSRVHRLVLRSKFSQTPNLGKL
eukprot:3166240-Pleurochrysis_carterae.AAC.1